MPCHLIVLNANPFGQCLCLCLCLFIYGTEKCVKCPNFVFNPVTLPQEDTANSPTLYGQITEEYTLNTE